MLGKIILAIIIINVAVFVYVFLNGMRRKSLEKYEENAKKKLKENAKSFRKTAKEIDEIKEQIEKHDKEVIDSMLNTVDDLKEKDETNEMSSKQLAEDLGFTKKEE